MEREKDLIKEDLIKTNINDTFYDGIKKAMEVCGSRRFKKPTIGQYIVYKVNHEMIASNKLWIVQDVHTSHVDSFVTEVFVTLQFTDNFSYKDFLFESGIVAYYDGAEVNPLKHAFLDPSLMVIALGKVDIKNKEFNGLLMSILKSRAFYNYPTVVVVDARQLSFSRDGVLYYDFKQIESLGYVDATKILALCMKRDRMSGEQLNQVIIDAATK